jgi:hypothetical protein
MLSRRRAFLWYLLATVVVVAGVMLAAARYPGSFDWAYTVISALASQKHNPAGAAWFAAALAIAMPCLWPVVTALLRDAVQRTEDGGQRTEDGSTKLQGGAAATSPLSIPRWIGIALRVGVVCGTLVGVERLVFFHFSTMVRKGHELLALVAFLSFYAGVVGLYVHRIRQRLASPWSVAVVLVPLLGVGFREGYLYFAQRHLGWADYDWKGTGAPLWLSFAMWQWLAAALLWFALGHLLISREGAKARS